MWHVSNVIILIASKIPKLHSRNLRRMQAWQRDRLVLDPLTPTHFWTQLSAVWNMIWECKASQVLKLVISAWMKIFKRKFIIYLLHDFFMSNISIVECIGNTTWLMSNRSHSQSISRDQEQSRPINKLPYVRLALHNMGCGLWRL
jgi:hypothetical protein